MSKTDDILGEILDEIKKLNSKIETLADKFQSFMPKLNINPMDIFKNIMQGDSKESEDSQT